MKILPLLSVGLFILSACDQTRSLTEKVRSLPSKLPPIMKSDPGQLRLESNLSGTAFCLGGAPLLSSDTHVKVYGGDRVYIVSPAPEIDMTVVAAKNGYYPFR